MKHKIKKGLSLLKKILMSDTFKVRVFYYISRRYVKIKDKTILYESYHGKSMTGNPYAMYLYMLNDDRFKDYQHIWILSDTSAYAEKRNTKLIKRNSLKSAYYLLASKYLINNTTFLPFVNKRKEQIYVNTWHGTPLKTLGKDVKFSYGNARNVCKNLLQTDYFISPNKYTTDIFLRSNDIDTLYPGKIIENGYPRNDLLFISDEKKNKLRKDLNIDRSKKTILYAPTFRGSHLDAESHDKTFVDFIKALKEGFDNTYNILTKLHHIDNNEDIVIDNVPSHVDTNELLSIVDILITDYSSISFDFLALKKPILYYLYDLEEYIEKRGLYIDIAEMPGVKCFTPEKVIHAITTIDNFWDHNKDKYEKSILKFCKYDDGQVSHKIVNAIFFNNTNEINIYSLPKNNKKSILLYGGGFLNNGVTSSLVALLNNISYERYNVFLISNSHVKGNNFKRIVSRVPSDVKIIYLPTSPLKLFQPIFRFLNINKLEKIFNLEYKHLFGNTHFDIAIDYSGYGNYWASLIAFSKSNLKYIYLHSDMKAESIKRSHLIDLKFLFKLYTNYYDKLITVSASSLIANKIGLPALSDKVEVIHNPIDANRIINLSNEESHIQISNNKTNFISIGRYSTEKGQDNLIKAFSKLCKYHDNLHLYLVGHGPLHSTFKKLIDDLNMQESITLTGNMENPFTLLKECDCFVLPSHYEGQGLVLLEALVLGIPCISTDIPGPRSILKDGQGLLVEDSPDGLKEGMEAFLQGKVPYKLFDYKKYTTDAMKEFYKNI